MRYPGAEWKPLSVNYQPGGCRPRYLILHIMEGTLAGTDSWFRNPAAEVSAHFGVGKDGTLYQWVDTGNTAWHAVSANPVAIGVEHEGDSGQVLTDAQLETDAKLLAWATEHHPIPMQITDNPVDGAGLAWHGLGGAAWGGHLQCPGAPIVAQRPRLLAMAKAVLNPPAPVNPPGGAVLHVTAGEGTLAELAAANSVPPSTIIRLTTEHTPDGYPQNIGNWLNAVFEGTVSPGAAMPAGLNLYVPGS